MHGKYPEKVTDSLRGLHLFPKFFLDSTLFFEGSLPSVVENSLLIMISGLCPDWLQASPAQVIKSATVLPLESSISCAVVAAVLGRLRQRLF